MTYLQDVGYILYHTFSEESKSGGSIVKRCVLTRLPHHLGTHMKSIQDFALFLGDLSCNLHTIWQDHILIFSSSVSSPSTEYLLFSSASIIILISFILKIKARDAMKR
jgi:hypothetical protein